MTRRLSRRAVLARGLAAIAAPAAGASTPALAGPTPVGVRAIPIRSFSARETERTRFGDLVFRGGFEMSAPNAAFGGFSGLAMSTDGDRLVAISDRGAWLAARLSYDGRRPTGLADAVLAPMLNAAGTPLKRTRAYDTECLCMHEGVAYVGMERVNQVLRFDWAKTGFNARGRPIPLPPGVSTLPLNRGLEAIGVATDGGALPGALVAIAEQAREGAEAATLGFVLTGASRGSFEVARSDAFDITDCAFVPGGDMLLLERRFAPLRGIAMRIRRIPGRTIRPGARLDGPALITADMGEQIDNMEAIGFHRDPEGAGVITLLSDDNFSIMQRSLLLQFTLAA